MDLGMQLRAQQNDSQSKVSGTGSFSLARSSTKFGGGLGKSSKLDESMKSAQGGIGVPTLEMLNPELFKEMQKADK